MELRLLSFLGIFVMILIAWLFSNNRRHFDLRIVVSGLGLQFLLALIILRTEFGHKFFDVTKDAINAVISLSDKGASFVFGANFEEHFFAFKVMPTIVFVSSLSYLLFYWGVIQKVTQSIAWVMQKTMNISAAEGLVTAANIFCGQTEAPLFVKPYLKSMTVSEINTMMTGGMATVAGGVLAAYVGFGMSAGHLLAASLMSAPAAIMIAKIMYPEDEVSKTKGEVSIHLEQKDSNAFEAACNGASGGLMLALNVAAMLVAFIALVALINLILAYFGSFFGLQPTLEGILGVVFQPLAFVMGISWDESFIVGRLLGEKMVINEFLAYSHLGDYMRTGALSERSIAIATYALCGFANFSSIAIQIGGIGALEPSRKKDFALCGFKAMIGGTLATLLTGCVAGILL